MAINTPAIIGAALKDVFGGRLGLLAVLCLVAAVGATAAAAWAGFQFLLPMIDAREWDFSLFGFRIDPETGIEILAGAGVIVLSLVLAPVVSMIVGGALFDVAAARMEKAIGAPPGRMVSVGEGIANGVKIALPALFFNIIAIPFYFVPVVNAIVFWWLNGFLMGREYSALAAVRRMSWAEARALRKRAPVSVFMIGFACAFIPFLAPLVGASAMTRLVTALRASPQPRGAPP